MTTTTRRRLSRPELTRRLLKQEEVALKIGLSSDRFYRVRSELEKSSFPPPLPGFVGSKWMKWDEKAIDLWLDAQMPEHIRKFDRTSDGVIIDEKIDTAATEKKLSERANGMAL